jgi:myo-inositol-1-phosphate synthase
MVANSNSITSDIKTDTPTGTTTITTATATSYSSCKIAVNSPNFTETPTELSAKYEYKRTAVNQSSAGDGKIIVRPETKLLTFKTSKKVPKLGVMLVGWGGNNGSTITASILANKQSISWETRRGIQKPNWYGSIMMASTIRIGYDETTNQEVYIPLRDVLPMVHPNDIIIGGWDINKANLYDAMIRSEVLEPDLRSKLKEQMSKLVPLPSIYSPTFIAANQNDRANNLMEATQKSEQIKVLRQNIRDFKASNELDDVIVLWTANTERFADIIEGVNDTAEHLLASIELNHDEISPSSMFAIASILEGSSFINGSPQNTFVPGVIQLATQKGVYIGGDDFKSGQTKMKSVMVDFLVNAGIKPVGITSYNHLGNNDGKNLSAPEQFRSKEISKSNVVDDVVMSNRILYEKGEKPDHVVVIKYVPSVGDSKRALDEYENEIFMGGRNTISMHNTCEDSLLASPLIIDLVLLAELLSRISITYENQEIETNPISPLLDTQNLKSKQTNVKKFNSVLSLLSYMLKAPLVPEGAPLINSLFRQRNAIENLFRACLGLAPESDLMLESRLN